MASIGVSNFYFQVLFLKIIFFEGIFDRARQLAAHATLPTELNLTAEVYLSFNYYFILLLFLITIFLFILL